MASLTFYFDYLSPYSYQAHSERAGLHVGLTQSLDASMVLEARHLIESGRRDEAIAAFHQKGSPIFHRETA